jgi:integrase
MASLTRDPNGSYTIQLVCKDGKRRSIRLGAVNKKTANEVKLKVETLHALAITNLPLDAETAQWVNGVGDDLAAKLAAVGLIPPREAKALGAFLNAYLEQRRGDSKPATAVTIQRVVTDLTAFLGATTDLRAVTVECAEGFKQLYQGKKLAPATIYRRLKMAKMLFGHAVKLKLIDANPFADVKSKNHNPRERRHYVPAEDVRKLLDAANPTWRTIIALSRFVGLRCPSEVLSLKWEYVNLATGRMVVHSPKTEHLEGRSQRVVPVFAALRPFLEEAWELAAPGEECVVGGSQGDKYRAKANGPNGWVNMNLRTTFEKLIVRAGLVPWPKLFHNLRASCETDLMANHPIHVVTAWIGNTPKIALGHYLQTLDADFEKAVKGGAESGAVEVQNAVQSPTAASGLEVTQPEERLENKDSRPLTSSGATYCSFDQLAKVGLEPTRFYPLDFESSASAIPPLGRADTRIDRRVAGGK